MRALMLAALLLSGCGKEAVLWVQVSAPLRCPDECDTLLIDITRANGTPVQSAHYDLRTRAFPQSTSFSTGKAEYLEAPGLHVTASVLLRGELAAAWATGSADAVLHDGQTAEVDFAFAEP